MADGMDQAGIGTPSGPVMRSCREPAYGTARLVGDSTHRDSFTQLPGSMVAVISACVSITGGVSYPATWAACEPKYAPLEVLVFTADVPKFRSHHKSKGILFGRMPFFCSGLQRLIRPRFA